jgi:hypothetical protein
MFQRRLNRQRVMHYSFQVGFRCPKHCQSNAQSYSGDDMGSGIIRSDAAMRMSEMRQRSCRQMDWRLVMNKNI